MITNQAKYGTPNIPYNFLSKYGDDVLMEYLISKKSKNFINGIQLTFLGKKLIVIFTILSSWK